MSNDIVNLYSLKCYNYYVHYFLIIKFGHVNGHIDVVMYAMVKQHVSFNNHITFSGLMAIKLIFWNVKFYKNYPFEISNFKEFTKKNKI
jgi:hypothetical protein